MKLPCSWGLGVDFGWLNGWLVGWFDGFFLKNV